MQQQRHPSVAPDTGRGALRMGWGRVVCELDAPTFLCDGAPGAAAHGYGYRLNVSDGGKSRIDLRPRSCARKLERES